MLLVGLDVVSDTMQFVSKKMNTYKRQTAVCAPADLGLICVDEDPGVSEGTTASVTGYSAVVCPADGLLVDELDGGIWARLHNSSQPIFSLRHRRPFFSATI